MNTLEHNVLMYDEYCPLCRWYSYQFVKLGFIKEEERKSYQSCMKYKGQIAVDFDEAKNKIAYYHVDTQKAYYGVDSIVEVLSHRLPNLMKIASWKPIYLLLCVLYNFISYNRKLIAPSMMCGGDSCTPDKNWKYRIAFIVLAWVMVVAIVGRYFLMAYPGLLRWEIAHIDAYVFSAQFIFQGLILLLLKKRDHYEYFGHLAYVSLIGAIILWTMYVILKIGTLYGVNVAPLACTGFGATLGIMFMVHRSRMKDHNLPSILTYTWLLFRLVVACIIFNFW